MRLRDYAGVARRNWLVVAATIAVGVVAAGVLSLVLPPKYTASSEVVFSGHADTGGQDLAYLGGYVQARMQTYRRVAEADDTLLGVQKLIGSGESIEQLRSSVDIEISQLNTVVTIKATDRSRIGAARTANAVAQALLGAVHRLDGTSGKAGLATVEGRVISTATPPGEQSAPNLELNLAAGALLGLIVSIAVVGVREALKGEPTPDEAR